MQGFTPWTERETKVYQDAEMLASNWYARRDAQKTGWMTWKKNSAGKEYLFHGTDNAGNGKYLGARTAETEAQLDAFSREKSQLAEEERLARDETTKESRFVRAVRLNRMPDGPAKIIRTLERAGFGRSLHVVGTHALYAYEVAASIRFAPDLTATRDIDLLWDSQAAMELAVTVEPEGRQGFLDTLKKIDSSFTVSMEHSFRVTSAKGLIVDFLMAEPDDGRRPAKGDKLRPIGLAGQRWLLASPAMERVAFSQDGLPIRLRVPQPTLFAAHKEWVAARPDRNPGKRARDLAQAAAVWDAMASHLSDDAAFAPPPELVPFVRI